MYTCGILYVCMQIPLYMMLLLNLWFKVYPYTPAPDDDSDGEGYLGNDIGEGRKSVNVSISECLCSEHTMQTCSRGKGGWGRGREKN